MWYTDGNLSKVTGGTALAQRLFRPHGSGEMGAHKEVFWRIFAPRAYATLYSQYQFLRSSIDEMEEEARCDVIDAENEVRRLQRENQALRQQIDALTAQLQALQT